MDISIPVIDGWEATQVLKHDPQTRDIPIIALTAHALASDREKAMEVGCDGYLAKPCEPRAVVAEVQRSSGRVMEAPRERDAGAHPDRRRSRGQRRAAAGAARVVGLRHRVAPATAQRRSQRSRQSPPDLILLDVMMPKIDGIEVARRVKGNADLPFIPIIMQTALDATENKVEGLEAGADDYITKPIDFAELKARLTLDAAHQAAAGGARGARAAAARGERAAATHVADRRAHGARQSAAPRRAHRRDVRARQAAERAVLLRDVRSRPVQERERHLRPPGGRRGAQAVRADP